MRLKTLILSVLSLVAITAQAQLAPVPEEMKKLEWMVGTWAGKVKWTMTGMDPMDGEMSMTNTMEGPFMKQVSKTEMMGMTMVETGYVGWDAKKKQYMTWTFTNFSSDPRVEVGQMKGDVMVFNCDGWDVMGQVTISRATMTKKSAKEVAFLLEFKENGKWTKAGEGTFMKK